MARMRLMAITVSSALPLLTAGMARADNMVVQQDSDSESTPEASEEPEQGDGAVVQNTTVDASSDDDNNEEATADDEEAEQQSPQVQHTTINTGGDGDHEDAEDERSVFSHGYQGLLAGAAVGAGTGYLVSRRGGWESGDLRIVGVGLGVGAMVGAGLGVSLGLADHADADGSRYVARDMLAGTGFGVVLGSIGGGVAAALNRTPENVLAGASIGAIAGASTGLLVGVIEGQIHDSEQKTTVTTTSFRVRPDLAVTPDANGNPAVGPAFAGRF